MARYKKFNLADLIAIRRALGENQQQFWSRFGVTQSGGSRYERDVRRIPTPVAMLLGLFLASKITDTDLTTARKAVGRFNND